MPAQKKNNLAFRVIRTINRYALIEPRDRLVVSVSGGPDSVALLCILNSFKKKMGLELHIAHLDHMLRQDSYRDLLFVKGLAESLRLPITLERVAVRRLAKKGSLEEIARRARLDFLFKVTKNTGAKKIAVGHTRDDQAETVLMRIIRGSGLYGLSGIAPVRNIGGFTIIRPLIEISRCDIDNYLKAKKIKARLDTSNLDTVFFRNKISRKLIPILEKEYNPNIKELLANMAENIGMDYDYLLKQGIKAFHNLKSSNGNSKIRLSLSALIKLHPALQNIVLRLAFKELKGDTRRLTFQHIKELRDLIFNRPFNSVVDLPAGISVILKRDYR